MKDLLPIGSVVTLKKGTKKLMIIGRFQQNVKTKKIYDYAGCLWPEGYMDKEHSYVFNHEDIDILYYLGMQDIEEFNFRSKLDEMIKKLESEGFKHYGIKRSNGIFYLRNVCRWWNHINCIQYSSC